MSKRERVIIAVMVLVVIYGIYSLFFSSSGTPSPDTAEDTSSNINNMIAQMITGMGQTEDKGASGYISRRAEEEWKRDPMPQAMITLSKEPAAADHDDKASAAEKTPQGLNPDDFIYSGYLEMGKKKIVLINGMEYESGEQLRSGPYILHAVHADRVVIGLKGTQGKGGKITVRIQEEIF